MPTLKGGTLEQLAGDYKTTTEELQKLNPDLRTDTTYTVGEVKFPETQVDTSQPSPTAIQPTTDLSKVGTGSVGPDGKPIYDVFAGQEHIADPNDPRLKGIDIAGLPEGQAPSGFQSKFETGFQQANQALGDTAGDVKDGSVVNKYSPQKQNDFSSMFVQNDEVLGEITKSLQEFMNPTTQRETLVSAYKSMSKELGLEPLNEKILNLEKIMRGTDEAIREQITASGGFANENSIRGLVNVRNKAFLEEYTTLQQTLASKQRYLDNLMGLEAQDRQAASERFNQGLNIAFKLADYQQRGQQFAQSSYQWIVQQTGFDGLYEAANGDPYAIDLIERTLGLPPNGLSSAANQARLAAQTATTFSIQDVGGRTVRFGFDTQGNVVSKTDLGKTTGVAPGPEKPEKNVFDETRKSLQQYKDQGFSQEEVEQEWRTQNAASGQDPKDVILPLTVQRALDELYPKATGTTETSTTKEVKWYNPLSWF